MVQHVNRQDDKLFRTGDNGKQSSWTWWWMLDILMEKYLSTFWSLWLILDHWKYTTCFVSSKTLTVIEPQLQKEKNYLNKKNLYLFYGTLFNFYICLEIKLIYSILCSNPCFQHFVDLLSNYFSCLNQKRENWSQLHLNLVAWSYKAIHCHQ